MQIRFGNVDASFGLLVNPILLLFNSFFSAFFFLLHVPLDVFYTRTQNVTCCVNFRSHLAFFLASFQKKVQPNHQFYQNTVNRGLQILYGFENIKIIRSYSSRLRGEN